MIRILLLFASFLFAKEEPLTFSHESELKVAIDAAYDAGSILMQYWNKKIDLETEMKDGKSPVTIADFESNDAICKKLLDHFPEYGLLTEEKLEGERENQAILKWRDAEWTWVVDPLDGTKSFIGGKSQFGIHIALLHHGEPVVGVNYYPATKTMYFATVGSGAYKQVKNKPPRRIFAEKKAKVIRPVVSSKKSDFVKAFYSSLLGQPITDKMLRKDFKSLGSCGLRLCMIAEGKRNIYASSGQSGRIWDYASGAVILKEAGGTMTDLLGKPLDFLSPNYKFKSGTLSVGPQDLFEKAIMKNSPQR